MTSVTGLAGQAPTATGNPDSNETLMSGDGTWIGGQHITDEQETVMAIITYVGAGVAILGVCLTLLSYIGYRKFHIKRPHIVMVNLCFCLFLYYLAYLISNPDRQSRESYESSICVFGAIVCQYAILATWFWILVYWLLVFVMFKRPMGGHISHFFIKASFPSYGIPIIITIICVVVAHHKGELHEGGYYGKLCFVDKFYLYFGTILPVVLMLIPMLAVFIMLLKGIMCEKEEKLKSSNTRKNIKRHFLRLSIITVLFISITTCGYIVRDKGGRKYSAMIVFGVLSSILGLALMVLFCLHHEEIRDHWMSVIRGEDPSMRKHSISRTLNYDVSELSSARKSSTLKGNPPSMYIESYEDERKSSTYRIVAKEDTDMSTLGLIQIPGTPSPARANDANDNPSADVKKVGRKKSDASKAKHTHKEDAKSTKQNARGLEDINESDTGKPAKKKSRSTSTPPPSPREKSTKRQQTTDALFGSASSPTNESAQQTEKKRPSKRSKNPAHRLSRLARRSTSTGEDETQKLTDL